jgi:hypothetical protein
LIATKLMRAQPNPVHMMVMRQNHRITPAKLALAAQRPTGHAALLVAMGLSSACLFVLTGFTLAAWIGDMF